MQDCSSGRGGDLHCPAMQVFVVTLNASVPFTTATVLCTVWERLTGTMRESLDTF